MERVCPACNRLELKEVICKVCASQMADMGRAQEVYQDDYTANMPINDAYSYCIHLFKCDTCGNSEKTAINKIVI